MDKETKKLYQEVLNQNQLEVNLPLLFNSLADKYYTQAAVKLSMHYYACYELYLEEGDGWGDSARNALQQLNRVIKEGVLRQQGAGVPEEAIRSVDKLRNELIVRMKQLIAYGDICRLREYTLNRIEYRFKEAPNSIDDEQFAKEILQYIFESQDNVVINDHIREIIGQLPVRITKQRYFDLLKGSIKEYLGASQDTLESYLYMLRSASALELPEDMEKAYPVLWKQKELLNSQDYTNISAEDFASTELELKTAIHYLESEIEVFFRLQEMVNEVYAMLLCAPYAGMSVNPYVKGGEAAMSVISGINTEFYNEHKQEPSLELMEHFYGMEGVQEELSLDLALMEEALLSADMHNRGLTESIMADKQLNVLLLSKDLLSNSLFIDFYEIKSNLPVQEEQLEKEANKLISEMTELFQSNDRLVCRAIMANTLNKLPVFFQSHKEVMDYVLYSLEKCSDLAEKAACKDIINEIMSA